MIVITLVVLLTQGAPLEAKSHGPVSEIKKILGPFPAHGSAEEARDLALLLKFQDERTDEECRLAGLESNASLTNFIGKHHKLLSKRELRWLKIRLFFPLLKSTVVNSMAKRIYKRPRPFLTWTELNPCIRRPGSTAYPSGHATLARLYARLLSRIYPKRAGAFMKRADEAARYRVLGGVHHPSDVEAGKKLGDALAGKVMDSKEFLSLLEEAGVR